MRRNST